MIDVHREEDSAQFHAETYGPYPVVGWHIRRDDGIGATVASPHPAGLGEGQRSATVIVRCVPDGPLQDRGHVGDDLSAPVDRPPNDYSSCLEALRCPPGRLSLVRNVLAENRWHDEAGSDRSTRGQLMDGNVSERKGEVS